MPNVDRNAQESDVRVKRTETNRACELRVDENGRGITTAEMAAQASIGLLGMRERANQAGATLELAGLPGKGTVIKVRVPLPGKIGKRPAASRHQRTPKRSAR